MCVCVCVCVCVCCFGWPAAGAAGQFEIAAVTPRRTGAARAAPGWPPSARVSGRPRSTARPPQGLGDRRRLACAGALLWPAEVYGTPSVGVRDHLSPAPAGTPLWPAEVEGAPAAGVGGPPLPATCGRPAQARRGRRRAGRTPTEPSPGRRPAVGCPYPGAGAPSRRDGPGA